MSQNETVTEFNAQFRKEGNLYEETNTPRISNKKQSSMIAIDNKHFDRDEKVLELGDEGY